MLTVTSLMGFSAGAGNGLIASYIGRAEDTTNGSSYTFSGQSIGAASSDRLVVVCIGYTAAGTVTTTSLTIGGNAASQAVEVTTSGGDKGSVAIYYLAVPTGTTADVVASLSGSASRCDIEVFTLTGLTSTTPTTTNSDTASPPSAAVTPAAGGVVIGMAKSVASTSCTWTNLTEDADNVVETAATFTSAHASNLPASSLTVTATFASHTSPALALAAWR